MKTQHIVRMWPRALFHMKKGKKVLRAALKEPGVYVLYREDRPYYIGKTRNPLINRLRGHALTPNWRRYIFFGFRDCGRNPQKRGRSDSYLSDAHCCQQFSAKDSYDAINL